MTTTTDWNRWHDPYEQPGSNLARRLRVIQGHIGDWMDATAPEPVTVMSSCAGDGRDLIEVLAHRPDSARITANLLESDPDNVSRARDAAAAAGLHAVTVACVDAGRSDAYLGAVPADLVLLCGVFGNIGDTDVHRLIRALPQMCRPQAWVVWTRHHSPPDLTPAIRRWLAEEGFDELAFTAPTDAVFSVGAHQYHGPARPLVPGQELFTFFR
jgi:hypothetical protein